jgi:5'-nucleotidase / UDP-sugar diphosphatase
MKGKDLASKKQGRTIPRRGNMIQRWSKSVAWIFAFVLLVSFAEAEPREVRILHLNDLHGFADPYKPFGSNELLGGIAYLATKADQLRQEKPSLLLSAGDMIQGSNWANFFQGQSVIELMNAMKFDAMEVGNHEFDFGQDVLKKRISEAAFPVLGANVVGIEGLRPFVIKETNGIKIAIIGVVTEDTAITTHPKNAVGLKFLSSIDTVRKYLGELRKKADIVIVLSHTGHPADRILAEKVKGIDLIVGGHSHTKIERPVQVGKTIIVQSWEHAKALGVLDLTVDAGTIVKFDGHLEGIKPVQGQGDPAVEAIVKKYDDRMGAVLNEKVGEAEVELDGDHARSQETNLGDLVADILREVSGADAAMINGGAIRTSIKKGEIKVRDVYTVLPFDDYIVAIKLTGRQIREALEHGVSAVEKGEGRFPQVSGLSFTYSASSPPGKRIRRILIGGKPLDPRKEYKVATHDFLAAGGDGYQSFGKAIKSSKNFAVIGGMMKGEKVVYSDAGRWLRDVVVEYIKEKKTVAPVVEGRIKEDQR